MQTKQDAIDSNLEAFLAMLPGLLLEQSGRYVLLRHGQPSGFFATALDAQIAGNQQFPDTLFSVQKITDIPEHLTHFMHALHHW